MHTTATTTAYQKDGLAYLSRDHEVIKKCIRNVKEATTFEEKKHKARELIQVISKHASIEEQCVTPLYRKHLGAKGEAWADRTLVEDQLNKEIMAFLESKSILEDEPTYDLMISKLDKLEQEHLNYEDSQLFPLLREKLDARELEHLEDALVSAHKYAPLHPHPMAPNKPSTGATILHPLVGAIERLLEKEETPS